MISQIDVWYTFPEEFHSHQGISLFHSLLSPEEKEQWQRFKHPPSQHEYLITRGFIRNILSKYSDINPHEWIFTKNQYGRPFIKNQKQSTPLYFNISHSHEVIVCVLAHWEEIGIDVEYKNRNVKIFEVAEHVFSLKENEDLRKGSLERAKERFFQYWTLKEAYIKARGMGLALPLKDFAFTLDSSDKIQIQFDHGIDTHPELWNFQFLSIKENHPTALAFRNPHQSEVKIKVEKWLAPDHSVEQAEYPTSFRQLGMRERARIHL